MAETDTTSQQDHVSASLAIRNRVTKCGQWNADMDGRGGSLDSQRMPGAQIQEPLLGRATRIAAHSKLHLVIKKHISLC